MFGQNAMLLPSVLFCCPHAKHLQIMHQRNPFSVGKNMIRFGCEIFLDTCAHFLVRCRVSNSFAIIRDRATAAANAVMMPTRLRRRLRLRSDTRNHKPNSRVQRSNILTQNIYRTWADKVNMGDLLRLHTCLYSLFFVCMRVRFARCDQVWRYVWYSWFVGVWINCVRVLVFCRCFGNRIIPTFALGVRSQMLFSLAQFTYWFKCALRLANRNADLPSSVLFCGVFVMQSS